MGFALPLALLLAATIVGPILAHLVRRTELPRRPFPAVKLLERVASDARSRRRISDLPLLLARIAVILALVLGVASPFMRVAVLDGDGRIAALGIVIDDSLSMRARSGGATLFDDALSRARSAISGLPEGSEVTVVLGGNPPRVLAERSQDLAGLAQSLRSPRDAVRGDALARATELVTRRLLASRLSRRRLVIISDFAKGTSAGELSIPRGFDFEPVVLRPSSTDNLGVLVTSTGQGASPAERTTELRVVGHATRADVKASVLVADDVVASTSIRVAAGTGSVTWRARREAPARVALDIDDALPDDDEADIGLADAAAPRVLLVNGDPSGSLLADEVAFARRALELAPAPLAFRVRVIDESALSAAAIASADVIVLANTRAPSQTLVNALRERVEHGAGLLIAPGNRVNGAEYATRFGALLPARIASRAECPTEGIEPPREGRDRPAFIGLDGLLIESCSAIEPTLGAALWLRAPSGMPLIAAHTRGTGRVAVMAVSLDDDDSDLPLRPGFIPSIASLMRVLSGKGEPVASGVPATESDLRPGTVPRAQRGDAAEGRPSVLERDVGNHAFALFGLLVLLEGILRERKARQRVPSTSRSTSP